MGFPGGMVANNLPTNAGDMEKEMATHSYSHPGYSMREEPGGLQSMGLQKIQTRLNN